MSIVKTKRMEKIPAHPLADFVCGWFFSQQIGKVIYDLSGNVNTAIEQQDALWVASPYGYARYFSGNDYLLVADDVSQDLTGAHTIIIYAKSSTMSALDYAFFLCKRGGSGGNYQAYARYEAGVGRRMKYWNGSTVITGNAATGWNDNRWIQFAYIHDGANIKFYQNMGLKDTQALALGVAKRESVYINSDSGANYGKSTIDYILIYNRAILQTQLVWIYENPIRMLNLLRKKRAKYQSIIAA